MLVTYLGTNSFYQGEAFFDSTRVITSTLVSVSSTQIVVNNSVNGMTTTITGTGLTAGADGLPTGGTITSFSFLQNSVVQATTTDINWSGSSFTAALKSVESANNYTGIAQLIDQSSLITIDASKAIGGFFQNEAWDNFADLLTTPMKVTDSVHTDEFLGTIKDDTFKMSGNNSDYDDIEGTIGNDTIDLSGISDKSFLWLDYENVPGSITVDFAAGATNATVTGSTGWMDTIIDAKRAFEANGLGFEGTIKADTFNVAVESGQWFNLRGNEGADVYNIHLGGPGRLSFNFGADMAPTSGLVANLATGVISNDGFGFTDQLNVLSGTGRLEIRATDNNDSIVGSSRDERFITEQGSDTVDGGGGSDTIRYSRSGAGAVEVNLVAGTAIGTWDGNAFTDTLINIENVYGSFFNDEIAGDSLGNILRGFDGDDSVDGAAGNDTILGDSGKDILKGGQGIDIVLGGDGDDEGHLGNIDASTNQELFAGWFDGGSETDNLLLNKGFADYNVVKNGDVYKFFDKAYTDVEGLGRLIANAENIEQFEGVDLSTLMISSNFAARSTTATGTAPTDMSAIRDFDGNDLGAGGDWKFIGQADVEYDGDAEFIYINQTNGRWATVGPDANGNINFADHGQGGGTRVVGIYIDPEVELDPSKKFGPFDSQQRFQNDLAIDNLTVKDAFDFDGDGFQEIYFKVNDGSAYLRALMHADGNIQYANYQSEAQVTSYLTGLGYDQSVLDAILI